ncbi:hypothetical protein B5M42_021385 [Paenibacillus athensensis]|uniref:Uncharacterized protein n=1 Tax=Paenibacillus athensensis TaxID=1967502 RepID=A0A4Y8PZP9_9BACL|nr:hypothetical protein [Paenibacillus athensensis]MCD1261358.1 hypothetical protein [Paenibacillus athensensis]
MEFPLWLQDAIQQRLDHVSERGEQQHEMNPCHDEENAAFRALFSSMDNLQLQAFMDWEGKFQFTQALENERLYVQGLRDGAQLAFALLTDPFSSGDNVVEVFKKAMLTSNTPEA